VSRSKPGWQSALDKFMAIGGAIIIIVVVGFMASDPVDRSIDFRRGEILVFTIGWLMNQAGLWNLSSRMMSGRRYLELREQVNEFIDLVRQLNQYTISGNKNMVEHIKKAMHKSIDSIADAAGISKS
jgi:hypothetical protein